MFFLLSWRSSFFFLVIFSYGYSCYIYVIYQEVYKEIRLFLLLVNEYGLGN